MADRWEDEARAFLDKWPCPDGFQDFDTCNKCWAGLTAFAREVEARTLETLADEWHAHDKHIGANIIQRLRQRAARARGE